MHYGDMFGYSRNMEGPNGWKIDLNVDRSGLLEKPLGDGERLPEGDIWHRAKKDAITVWFRLADGRDGTKVCTELGVESTAPMTSGTLRSIPLTGIVDRVAVGAMRHTDFGPPMTSIGLRRWYYSREEFDSSPEAFRAAYLTNSTMRPAQRRRKRGGDGPSQEDLEKFAEAYMAALRTDPRRVLAETVELLRSRGYVISRATAHRWRSACRLTDPPLLDPEQGGQS